MTAVRVEVCRWLREQSSSFFPAHGPVEDVSVEGHGVIFRARLAFADGSEQLIVKRQPRSSFDTANFLAVHERLISGNTVLRRMTPRFLGADRAGQWVVMQYVKGEPLEDRLLRAAAAGGAAMDACDGLLQRAGECLAEFHRTPAGAIGLEVTPRQNVTFLLAVERYVARYRWLLACAGLRDSDWTRFRRMFHPGRLNGFGDRVVPVDAQPKNVLVDESGVMHFIDLAYSASNPAMGAGLFLASIDRMWLRRPWMPARVLARWRGAFLKGYLPSIDDEVRNQLCFFYPWSLLFTIEQHCSTRPVMGRIAAMWYARQVARFIANTPPSEGFDEAVRTPETPLWEIVCAMSREDRGESESFGQTVGIPLESERVDRLASEPL